MAQVAEQRGIPHIINIAAAPQITEQGYKFVFRNFQTAPDIVREGLALIGQLFQATNTVPRTAVFMHVNDTFGQAMAKGIGAFMPRLTQLPFKIVDTISYDPAAKDLTVEVSKAKATNADFLLLVCRLNDAILLRREMVKQRWNPMGIISPGSPGMYEEQYFKTLGKLSNTRSPTCPGTTRTQSSPSRGGGIPQAEPEGHAGVPRAERRLHLRGDPGRRRCLQAREGHRPEALADAIRQTNITEKMTLGDRSSSTPRARSRGIGSAVQNLKLLPTVVLPKRAPRLQAGVPHMYREA